MVAIAFIPRDKKDLIKQIAAVTTGIQLLLAIMLWSVFDATSGSFQFMERAEWIPSLGISYILGIDGGASYSRGVIFTDDGQTIATEISEGKLTVLDVREPIEWEMGHVPEATLISLGELHNRTIELPRDSKVAVICEAGIRSSTAVSFLKSIGFSSIVNVPDGTGGYRAAGFPLFYFETGG